MSDLVKDHRVRIGGLMRCCLETLNLRADDQVPMNGVMECEYERKPRIRLGEDGVWRYLGAQQHGGDE